MSKESIQAAKRVAREKLSALREAAAEIERLLIERRSYHIDSAGASALDAELQRLRQIERAAKQLLDNASGHCMNAEDMYCLETALGIGDDTSQKRTGDSDG